MDERDFDLLLNRIVNNSMVLGVDLKRDDLQFVLEYDNEIVDTKRVSSISFSHSVHDNDASSG